MKLSVTIAGTGMTEQGRSGLGPKELAIHAARAALTDAGLRPESVAQVIVSNALAGVLSDQECVRGHAWLHAEGFPGAPIINVDAGCAGAATALHLGCQAVTAGVGPVLVVGVEKMWTGDRGATLGGIEQCLAADLRAGARAELANEAGSTFMGLNARWAEKQLSERATTPQHFAAAAVKARRLGELNPLAQQRRPVTDDEVLESTPIAGPLTRLMCSSFTDGAAAVVLQRSAIAGAPRIVASCVGSGDGAGEYHGRLGDAADRAWKDAGLGPHDVDVVELHDATAAEELYALEALGFYAIGDAGPATVAGETMPGGRGPTVNPSGGLVARGHPIGATGLCQVVELADQLRGRSGPRQAEGARVGFAVNTGGIINRDVASWGAHVVSL